MAGVDGVVMGMGDRVRVIGGGQPFIDEVGHIRGLTKDGLLVVVFADSDGVEFCSFPFDPHHLELAPLLPLDAWVA